MKTLKKILAIFIIVNFSAIISGCIGPNFMHNYILTILIWIGLGVLYSVYWAFVQLGMPKG